MKKWIILPISILILGYCEAQENKVVIKKLPNVVYILADDLGYGDLSSLNPQSGIKTPSMDYIVENGIQFADAHSNSSVCTPTRYGIITGRYAWRSRLKNGVLWGYDQPLIEEDRVTVASFLKDNGYNTACIGKWHLGLGWQPKNIDKPIAKYEWTMVFEKGDDSNVDFSKPISGPKELGFEYSYIIPSSLDMTPYLYIENGKAVELPTAYTEGKSEEEHGRGVFWRAGEVSPSFVFEEVLENITDKAISYIDDQKKTENPFFLYFPLTGPHTPWLPTEVTNGKSQAGTYGDFVLDVDNVVGRVIAALKKSGQLKNTLIIVTSDNGSHWTLQDKEKYAHRANYTFKGQKADIYEGGHHIPYIAMWPENIAPGSSSDQIICTTDLLATLSGVIGKPLPKGAGEDSYDMLKAYFKTDSDKQIRDYTIHHSLDGVFSVRKGKWKMTTQLGSGGFSEPKVITPSHGKPKGTLYDMENDINETVNLYMEHSEVVKELTNLLKAAKKK